MERSDFALSAAQRIDARAALRLLEGTGLSLEEAARRAVAGRRAVKRITIEDAIDQFVRSRLTNGKRAATVDWYESKLKLFGKKFGARHFDDVDRGALREWIEAVPLGVGTRAGIARAVRALWRWGMLHEPPLVALDVTLGLRTTAPGNRGEAGFLTVPEASAVLKAAGEYRSALAMLLFAGVRPEELAGQNKPRLLWRQVRLAEKMIRIPAEIAKTGRPRIIEGIPEALWAWLEPKDDGEAISPGRSRQAIEKAQAAIERDDWPHDATRHTFATYALASTGDAGKVATWLGHEGNPTMLHRHYRGLATKTEADKYWALRP
jgi:integrase